jgi:hypothetical protein
LKLRKNNNTGQLTKQTTGNYGTRQFPLEMTNYTSRKLTENKRAENGLKISLPAGYITRNYPKLRTRATKKSG